MGNYKKIPTITAICPLCGEKHKVPMKVQWIGNGIPRIYHENCRQKLEGVDSPNKTSEYLYKGILSI